MADVDASTSPFLAIPHEEHLACRTLCIAFRDANPVSPGHALIVPRRVVTTWFEATPEE